MTAPAATLAAQAMPATAELNDLMRSLARTFGRAQKRLAQRQEQLLAALRAKSAGGEPALRVKLPSGRIEELCSAELCSGQRKYLEDMVVDLTCLVQEVETSSGARLALRLLPRTARPRGAYPVRLSFGHDDPIEAKLCFANQVVRRVQLHAAELPSQEVSEQAQRAHVYLLDPVDAAPIRARATVIYPAAPPPGAVAQSAGAAASVPSATAAAPKAVPPAMPPGMPPVTPPVLPPETPPQVPSAAPPAAAASEAASQPAEAMAIAFSLAAPSPPAPELAPGEPAPIPAQLLPEFVTPRPPPALRARRQVQRYGLPLLLGLGAIGLAATLGPPLALKLRAPVPPLGVSVVRTPALPPPALPASGSPPPDLTLAPLPTSEVAAGPPLDAGVPPAAVPLAVRFYALDSEGVTSLTCNGRAVALTRGEQSGRSVARLLLGPGALCQASSSGKVRTYTYDNLAQGRADAAGERIVHIRFHKR